MARSGESVLTTTAAEIIETALRRARIIPVRQPVSSVDFETGLSILNKFVAKLRSQGWHLWKSEEYVLFLEQGKTDYLVGPTGDRAATLDSFIQDALTVATVATDTQLTISDTSEFTGSDDVLAFDPTDSTADWSTNDASVAVASGVLTITNTAIDGYAQYAAIDTTSETDYFFEVDITANTGAVTLEVYSGLSTTLITSQAVIVDGTQVVSFTATETSTILRIVNDDVAGDTDVDNFRLRETDTGEQIGFRVDASEREWNIVTRVLSSTEVELKNAVTNAASINASVFAFKELPTRPLKLTNYRSKNALFDDEIPVNTWSRSQYMKQTIKTSQGLPTQAYYQQKLDNGRLYIWQTASDVNQLVLFTADLPLELFSDTANNPDFPAEWFEMLCWGLAALLGPEYGIPPARQQELNGRAALEKEDAENFDEESGSLFMAPDNTRRG